MKMNDYLRWILYILLFATLITPLIVFNNFFFPYITGKVFTFRILVELAFFVWVLLALRDARFRPKLSGILLALGLFTLIYTLAGILGQDPARSFWSNFERMTGTVNYLHMFVYFLMLSSLFYSQKLWHGFFASSLVMSVFVGFQGLVHVGSVSRIDSSLGNPIYLAIYALFNIFLALFLIVNTKKLRYPDYLNWLYGLVALFNLAVLYYTGTRGTQLGLFGALFVMALLVALFERNNKKLRGVAAAFVIVLLLLPVGFYMARDTAFVQSHSELNRLAHISVSSGTGHSRLMLWRMAAEGFKEHPYLGWGPGNFGIIFAKYYNPDMYDQEMWFDRAHDIIFDRLTGAGAIGLLSYFLIFLIFLCSLWNLPGLRRFMRKLFLNIFQGGNAPEKIRGYFSGRNYKAFSFYEKVILTGALIGYFVHLLFVFDDLASLMMFMILLAFVTSQVSSARKPLFGEKEAGYVTRSFVVLIVGVVVVFGLYSANYLPIRQNLTLIDALGTGNPAERLTLFDKALSYNSFGNNEVREQMLSTAMKLNKTNASNDTLQMYYTYSLKEIDKSISERPEAPRPLYFKANLVAHFGQFDKAIDAIDKAIALSPEKQQFLLSKANYYLTMGQYEDAERVSKKTYEILKEDKQAAAYYAASLIYTGEKEQAKDVMMEAFGTTTVTNGKIIKAYVAKGSYGVAKKLLAKKVANDPGDTQLRVSLAYYNFKDGDTERAVEILQDLIKENPKAKDQLTEMIKDFQNGVDPAEKK